MNIRAARFALVVAAASLLLQGCAVTDEVSSWFTSSGKKSNLRGVRIPVMSLDEALKPDPELAKTPVLLPPPYRNAEWPLPGGYAANAMYHLAAPGRLREIWTQSAGKGTDSASALTSSPVVGGGMVFVLDSEAHVFAFRASDGRPAWDKELAPRDGTDWPTMWGILGKANTIDPSQGMGGGVAYSNGRIFVTSGFGVVICMDAKTGKEIWRKDMRMPMHRW